MNKLLYIFWCIMLSVFSFSCKDSQKESSKTPVESKPKEPVTVKVGPTNAAGNSALKRFENTIIAFEKADQENGIVKGKVLFIGSSSIRLWESLAKDMAPYPVLNRGFGGSTIPEVLAYFSRIVIPYEPGMIVMYCGENDIAEGAKPEAVFQSFNAFAQACDYKFPATKIVYIAMKPSVARWNLWPEYQKGNQLIKQLIDTKPNWKYIECSTRMLLEDGSIDESIFVEDGLHMNAKGYAGWTELVRPVLEEWYPIKNN